MKNLDQEKGINRGLAQEHLLTSREAGELVQVNQSSINKWVEQGRIRACRTPGGHRRIRASDLVEFLLHQGMPVPSELSRAGRRRLMIVDDDRKQLQALKRLFKKYQSRVELLLVDNGIDALIEVGSFRPQAIVLDVFMPDLDGIEVCRKLKANPQMRDIVLIITSAGLTSAVTEKAKTAGVEYVMSKPLDIPAVLAAMGMTEDAYF